MIREYLCGRTGRWRAVYGRDTVCSVKSMNDRLVLVPQSALGDLVEVAMRAAENLDLTDNAPLVSAIQGVIAQVRAAATFEP